MLIISDFGEADLNGAQYVEAERKNLQHIEFKTDICLDILLMI